MFKKVNCEVCEKKIGLSKQKYKDGYLCFNCHSIYCSKTKGFVNISKVSIEESVMPLLKDINDKVENWKNDLHMFNKNYSNTFYVDEVQDRMIVSGIEHKFNVSDILKYELVEQGTSSEVKELYIQILTNDEVYNYVKVRVAKASLNSTFKKTGWIYRDYLEKARQLIADLEVIKAKYEAKQMDTNNTSEEIVSKDRIAGCSKFCTQCGTLIVIGSKFCGECGHKL